MFRIIIRYKCRCSHDSINIHDIPSLVPSDRYGINDDGKATRRACQTFFFKKKKKSHHSGLSFGRDETATSQRH